MDKRPIFSPVTFLKGKSIPAAFGTWLTLAQVSTGLKLTLLEAPRQGPPPTAELPETDGTRFPHISGRRLLPVVLHLRSTALGLKSLLCLAGTWDSGSHLRH